ncbi:transketolase family protein [Haliscomenobacter hydrossis]|uniref:transketolase n=1 Tax=Haliscomenobacter hydrossis (strain ATCC 27775 / DSM 1100 / LMG 10767 / O) TaxID=760192 RepID=F4KW51_HALH1|nr:transketolase [Haliscomenobacter hydrossis]AEE48249.1 Transketolase [Haliscomenobacter hydrossis DSM 1100]
MANNLSLRAADNIRILSAAMVEKAQSGHPGGPMGGADFIHILYSEFLNYDPNDMHWPLRDRFFLDAGHMSAMLYAQQTLLGNYSLEDIINFRQWGSPTPGHPEVDVDRGIENTSGPLGLGHTFGIGSAIAERFLAQRFGEEVAHKTYIYISDGGVQEEISQGAGRIAGFLGLGNIVMFYDANDIQLSTEVSAVTSEDTAMKYEAWHWHVQTIVGNDHDALRAAIKSAIAETDRPSLIIGKTIMGKGVKKEDGSDYEGEVELHGKPLGQSKASFAKTIEGLGGDSSNPFQIFPDVAEYYRTVLDQKRSSAAARKVKYAAWEKANPVQAEKLATWLSGKLPEINWGEIAQKENDATRNASGNVLAYLAGRVENLIVASADLSNSDKTDSYLKKTTAFTKGDFSGSFLQAGVAELTMAALATGMSLHGGIVPVCATFFAFSDYMKPAIRVAALMEKQVIFVWTHDAFRVGEDGPTHQPVEQEAQLRLLEQLKNHSGKNSVLALRPADVHETTICWKLALENQHSPSGLILSRQNITDLPAASSRFAEATQAERGAYIVQNCAGTPDVILVANGSEVATLVAGAKKLSDEKGLKVRIVSAPSEGLFRNQTVDYQETVLPSNVPTFGLTAGLPVTMRGLVGTRGRVWGLSHFGYSAPFKVLDEKFGFTAENVFQQVVSLLG